MGQGIYLESVVKATGFSDSSIIKGTSLSLFCPTLSDFSRILKTIGPGARLNMDRSAIYGTKRVNMMFMPSFERATPLDKSIAMRHFADNFQEMYSPISPAEIESIRVLSEEDNCKLWKPDVVREALKLLRLTSDTLGKQAGITFKNSLDSAHQNNEFPRMFIRRFAQLRPHLYPLQLMHYCLPDFDPTMNHRVISDDPFYAKSYLKTFNWLSILPIKPSDYVYFSRDPTETLVLDWQTLIKHWDGFYHDRFCTANVIADDPRWFLFMYEEHLTVFGCTYEFAQERCLDVNDFISEPIDYSVEISKIRPVSEVILIPSRG